MLDKLKVQSKEEGWTKTDQLKAGLVARLSELILPPPSLGTNPDGPTVILVVGVNGSGKTTSIAKLGKRYKEAGYTVAFAAADTYRAAAVEQLQTWGTGWVSGWFLVRWAVTPAQWPMMRSNLQMRGVKKSSWWILPDGCTPAII